MLQKTVQYAGIGVIGDQAVAVPTQAADAGIHIFNGDGTGTDTVTFRIGNNIVLESVVSPLLYTVNPDCTGTITALIAPDGAEFARIATAHQTKSEVERTLEAILDRASGALAAGDRVELRDWHL